MFRKLSLLLIALFAIGSVNKATAQNTNSGQNADNLSEQKLYSYIDEYIKFAHPHIDSLKAAADYIIAFSDDSLLKPKIAEYLFDHFSKSPVMGQEAVAVYIARNYFIDGNLKRAGSGGNFPFVIYLDFNENSQIGMDAPELNLKDIYGAESSLNSLNSNYVIVYFFNDQCNICKKIQPEIKKLVESKKYMGITVFAVYTRYDAKPLEEYIAKEFPKGSDWVFALDSDNTSNFHRLYNVIKTPQIFLLDADKKIIGRNLDDKALEELLNFEEEKLDILNRETEQFISQYMPLVDLNDTISIHSAIGSIYTRSIAEQDKQVYRTLFTHIIEYLAHSEDPYAPEAALFIANRYILPDMEYWHNNAFMRDRLPLLLNRAENNRVGATIGDIVLYKPNGKKVNLHSIKSEQTYLYFFNNNCAICEAFSYELNKDYKKLKKKKVKVIGIYAGDNYAELSEYTGAAKVPWDILWIGKDGKLSDLFMKFEIGQIPQTYLLDKEKKIIAKRINTIKLKEIL